MNDHQDPLDQWLAYRREKATHLDIRQTVQRQLTDSAFPTPRPTQESRSFRFPLLRIATSTLIRLGVFAGWFIANT